MAPAPFVSSVGLAVPPAELPGRLGELAVVHALAREPLEFDRPVTVIGGDNGAGKSTFLEALAVALGYDAKGGSRNARQYRSERTVSALHHFLQVRRRANAADGWFLRGETHLDTVAYYAGLGGRDPLDLTRLSHGQSLVELVRRRFHPKGLYLLDEPEAGLSVFSQLELTGKLYHLAAGGAQLIIVTHSPVLMSIPGARLLELSADGFSSRGFTQMDSVAAMREFVADPLGTARFLVADRPDDALDRPGDAPDRPGDAPACDRLDAPGGRP